MGMWMIFALHFPPYRWHVSPKKQNPAGNLRFTTPWDSSEDKDLRVPTSNWIQCRYPLVNNRIATAGISPFLNRKYIDSIRVQPFQPATLDDRSVGSTLKIHLHFLLKENTSQLNIISLKKMEEKNVEKRKQWWSSTSKTTRSGWKWDPPPINSYWFHLGKETPLRVLK